MSYEQFLAVARSSEVRQLLRDTVTPHLRPRARAFVYPLHFTNRIGHLAPEPHFILTMFGTHYDQLVLLTRPRHSDGVNTALFDLLKDRFTLVETDQEILLQLGLCNEGIVAEQDFDLCLSLPARFYREYVVQRVAGTPLKFLELNERLLGKGAAWFNELGLDAEQPFIAFHVRDASYTPQDQYKAHGDMRSFSLEDYRPAAEWLLQQGYAVFRLGDRTASPADFDGPFFELPFLESYGSWMDVFLCGACRFSLNCQSGPEAVVRAFGNKSATTNLIPTAFGYHLDHDLILFRPVYEADSGEPMSYAEILQHNLPIRVLPFFLLDPELYDGSQFRLGGNSPEAILGAAQEMHERVETGDVLASSPANDRFTEMSQAYQARIAQNPAVLAKFFDQYTHAFKWGKLAEAQLVDAPNFVIP